MFAAFWGDIYIYISVYIKKYMLHTSGIAYPGFGTWFFARQVTSTCSPSPGQGGQARENGTHVVLSLDRDAFRWVSREKGGLSPLVTSVDMDIYIYI